MMAATPSKSAKKIAVKSSAVATAAVAAALARPSEYDFCFLRVQLVACEFRAVLYVIFAVISMLTPSFLVNLRDIFSSDISLFTYLLLQ
jgi:hypothetical protein